jgi:orotidine-5'-phosphate decarboxylase
LALDVDPTSAKKAISYFKNYSSRIGIKVGSTLNSAPGGSQIIELAKDAGYFVFFDPKFNDTPDQIGGSMHQIAMRKADLVSVHVSGGQKMIYNALNNAGDSTKVIGITVLTSIGDSPVDGTGKIGECEFLFGTPRAEKVDQFVKYGESLGLTNFVMSALEAPKMRGYISGKILAAGLKLRGGTANVGQKAVGTFFQASASYVDYYVTGMPWTRWQNEFISPAHALEAVLAEIEEGGK